MRRRARALLALGLAAAAVAVLTAGGMFVSQRRPSIAPLTNTDVLVLADFTNRTEEPVFDVTLREALAEATIFNLMQRRPKDFVLASRTLKTYSPSTGK